MTNPMFRNIPNFLWIKVTINDLASTGLCSDVPKRSETFRIGRPNVPKWSGVSSYRYSDRSEGSDFSHPLHSRLTP